ncbi:hypothetical protein IAT38_005246 [Cryptococcus sp. DSM 104549]
MLRRRLSTGLLRAASPSPVTTAPVCPLSPSRQRSRGLASAVLLNSQRNWKGETVAALKQELKKRGLSQQGNKATLVSRLESAETSSLLGPLPPFPNGSRSLSTSAAVAQPPKSKKAPTASAPPVPSDSDVDVAAPGVTTTGPQVSSQRSGAVVPDKVAPEQVTVAPGLPDSKVAAVSGGETLDVRIPGAKPDAEVDQIIPLTPDNFQSNSALPSSTPASKEPKILTVASASTHPAGGPTHGVHDGTDAHTLEATEDVISFPLPSLGAVGLSVFRGPANAWRSLGLGLPEVGAPSVEGSGEYKYEKRPLNEHERTGAWVLAGVLATGLVLGGSKSGKKDKHGEHGIVDAAKEKASKVKGDAKWEQASGAGVVGHGSRKD